MVEPFKVVVTQLQNLSGWMLFNKLVLGVPAVSVQPDTLRINPGPNSELSDISCSHSASAEQGQEAARLRGTEGLNLLHVSEPGRRES